MIQRHGIETFKKLACNSFFSLIGKDTAVSSASSTPSSGMALMP